MNRPLANRDGFVVASIHGTVWRFSRKAFGAWAADAAAAARAGDTLPDPGAYDARAIAEAVHFHIDANTNPSDRLPYLEETADRYAGE